eukprot:gene2737-5608_t
MAATIVPIGFGARLDPPALIIDYTERATGKNRRRIIPIRNITQSTCKDVVTKLKPRHGTYIDAVGEKQINEVLSRLREALLSVNQGNLNVLPDELLEERKKEMHQDFERHQISKDDPAFQYDVRKDFGPPKQTSNWDSDTGNSEESECINVNVDGGVGVVNAVQCYNSYCL